MKSFGVRLGAGAVTILFGAYAAAIAQKDRQDDSDSWSAESPSIAGPASPIADAGGDSWLDQPAAKFDDEPSAQELGDTNYQPAGSVQLVQHTEPIAGDESPQMPSFNNALPGSLGVEHDQAGDELSVAGAAPDTDWMMPEPSSATVDAADVGPAMSMTFPGPSRSCVGLAVRTGGTDQQRS